MPTWIVGVLQWAVGLALEHVSPGDVKRELAVAFTALDVVVQAAESRVTGPFKGVTEEIALEFHEATVAVVAALTAPTKG